MFFSLKEILVKKLESNPRIQKGLQEVKIKEFWQKISKKVFKEKTANLLEPLSFKNGILVVRALNHFVAQEAKIKEEEIKKEINDFLGKAIVKKIIYKIG